MPKVPASKNRSSQRVHQMKLARGVQQQEIHPEARGIARASVSNLTREGLDRDYAETSQRIQQQLEGEFIFNILQIHR